VGTPRGLFSLDVAGDTAVDRASGRLLVMPTSGEGEPAPLTLIQHIGAAFTAANPAGR
jgi:hypothetical protein